MSSSLDLDLVCPNGHNVSVEFSLGFPCPGEAELVPFLGRWSRSGWKGWGKRSHGGDRMYNRWCPGSQNGNPGLHGKTLSTRRDGVKAQARDRGGSPQARPVLSRGGRER